MPVEQMHDQFRIPLPAPAGQPLSEFNHHLAGAVVLLIGVSAILIHVRPQKFDFLKYVWPLSLLGLGAYLIVYSDPYAWPSGHLGLAESLENPRVRQHKVYALLLLIMGAIELARTVGIARSNNWKFAFPALAAAGALYLIVHQHGGGPGEHMHEEQMAFILYQHIAYVIVGAGIAVTRALHDLGKLPRLYGPYVWPSLTVFLGLMLMLYAE